MKVNLPSHTPIPCAYLNRHAVHMTLSSILFSSPLLLSSLPIRFLCCHCHRSFSVLFLCAGSDRENE